MVELTVMSGRWGHVMVVTNSRASDICGSHHEGIGPLSILNRTDPRHRHRVRDEHAIVTIAYSSTSSSSSSIKLSCSSAVSCSEICLSISITFEIVASSLHRCHWHPCHHHDRRHRQHHTITITIITVFFMHSTLSTDATA